MGPLGFEILASRPSRRAQARACGHGGGAWGGGGAKCMGLTEIGPNRRARFGGGDSIDQPGRDPEHTAVFNDGLLLWADRGCCRPASRVRMQTEHGPPTPTFMRNPLNPLFNRQRVPAHEASFAVGLCVGISK